jgi:hypothetical protein
VPAGILLKWFRIGIDDSTTLEDRTVSHTSADVRRLIDTIRQLRRDILDPKATLSWVEGMSDGGNRSNRLFWAFEQLKAGIGAALNSKVLKVEQQAELQRLAKKLREQMEPEEFSDTLSGALRVLHGGPPRAIVFIEDGLYRIGDDGEPFTMTESANSVLQAFLDVPAMSKTDLIKRSGLENAPRILLALRQKRKDLAKFISCPGHKANGGYRVAIRRA